MTGFRLNELDQAAEQYLSVERDISSRLGAEAVLVSVDSMADLKRAYPNYFLDTNIFIGLVSEALGSPPQRTRPRSAA